MDVARTRICRMKEDLGQHTLAYDEGRCEVLMCFICDSGRSVVDPNATGKTTVGLESTVCSQSWYLETSRQQTLVIARGTGRSYRP